MMLPKHARCAHHALYNGTITPNGVKPLVPDAHYGERQDKPFSLQIQQLEVNLK